MQNKKNYEDFDQEERIHFCITDNFDVWRKHTKVYTNFVSSSIYIELRTTGQLFCHLLSGNLFFSVTRNYKNKKI